MPLEQRPGYDIKHHNPNSTDSPDAKPDNQVYCEPCMDNDKYVVIPDLNGYYYSKKSNGKPSCKECVDKDAPVVVPQGGIKAWY